MVHGGDTGCAVVQCSPPAGAGACRRRTVVNKKGPALGPLLFGPTGDGRPMSRAYWMPSTVRTASQAEPFRRCDQSIWPAFTVSLKPYQTWPLRSA